MKFSIAKFAKSKYFVPGIVIGLVVFGWLVLLIAELGPFGEEKEEFVSQPTTWSQKEDYVIKETPEGKFVINEKAGLSFKVPKGWRVEMEGENIEGLTAEFWVTLLSPDTEFDINNFLKKGCGLSAWVEFQKHRGEYIKNEIEVIHRDPASYKINEYSQKEIIRVSGYPAIKRIGQSKNPEIFQRMGKAMEIQIPVNDETVLHIDTRFLPLYEEKCSQEFDKFLETVLIK